ncbi:tetratricopeptide repeat-containing sulfotransferase family protein [Prochlorococcus marinus]|uniref:Sulfotransferase family protein n=1 Tax=Prochlorococcus marinus XMU1408 TaxID=2213228 RepID=A0A318R2B5_PROMR|nr:sulfotransferase [Prochlorococcus marinus]MBW3041058.1 hypothetical protein [Prochlorococcus marinus str. XMU1408]PYE03665.1 sulfotransferase family protein [Prochlorococcus marinus XMU1408]
MIKKPGQEKKRNKKKNEIKIFNVPFDSGEIIKNSTINTNTPSNNYKEKIINQAFNFHAQGNISEAEKYYKKIINKGLIDYRVFSNYGIILKNQGKLKEAELLTRKAIKLKTNYAEAYSNLGNILRDLRKSKEAELSTRKAIELNPNFADAHLNLGNILRDLGKLKEAELSTRKAIELKHDFAKAHCNLGIILKDLGKLKEAELSTLKAIELKTNYAEAYSNLGNILKDLGKLKEAELSTRKAIELNADDAKAYYLLSLLEYSNENKRWQNQLFSKDILKNKLEKDQIDIYFARANILHKEKNYEESSKYLELANKLKLNFNPSNSDNFINKSKKLLIESYKKEITKKEYKSSSESIFIVGMFRSGSTLLESILSMSNNVYDLGEVNILEESFLQWNKSKQETNLAKLYDEKVNNKTKLNITTNKWLYNYQYAGIIARHIPNAKIIHCHRHPLDNILSIYRAHFSSGSEFSSSIIDCTRVYLDQEEIMSKYKNRFRSKIYDLNYDSLVRNPNQEIKSLISWLDWKWDKTYLTPHLNPRSVLTASNVQVRSPINAKSIGGWKNYKDMLKPAIEILTQIDRYQDLVA